MNGGFLDEISRLWEQEKKISPDFWREESLLFLPLLLLFVPLESTISISELFLPRFLVIELWRWVTFLVPFGRLADLHSYILSKRFYTFAMDSKHRTLCKKLMEQLCRHRLAGPFLAPVDSVALSLPDYYSIIKTPMDFGTIEV